MNHPTPTRLRVLKRLAYQATATSLAASGAQPSGTATLDDCSTELRAWCSRMEALPCSPSSKSDLTSSAPSTPALPEPSAA